MEDGSITLAGIWNKVYGQETGGINEGCKATGEINEGCKATGGIMTRETIAAYNHKIPEIWNGPHGPGEEPVGQLPAADGGIVLVWSYKPSDIMTAMIKAIGPIPPPPEILIGGHFEEFRQFDLSKPLSDAGPPVVVYDPSQDETNKTIASEYASQIEAWNKRAEVIYQMGMQLFANAPKS